MVYQLDGDTLIQNGNKYPAVTVQVGDDSLEKLPEAYIHDSRQLPHEIAGNLDHLFPRARAAPAVPEIHESQDPMEARGLAIGKASGG